MTDTIKPASAGMNFFSREMLHNWFAETKRNLKMMIVLAVLHLLGMPMIMIVLISGYNDGFGESAEMYAVISVLTVAAACLMGISCAVNCMPYLYKKTEVDMRLSLPMSSSQRFVSDLLSGLTIYLVPYLISVVMTFLLLFVGRAVCDGKPDPDGNIGNYFAEMTPYIAKSAVALFIMMLIYFMLTVLVMSCCGSLLESLVYTLLLNGLIPGMAAIVISSLCEGVSGMEGDFYFQFIIPFTSPAGAMILVVPMIVEMQSAFISFGTWAVTTFLVSVLYGVIAFLIYRHRKAEDTGKPIVYDIFYYVVMTMVLISVIFLFVNIEDDFIVPVIIFTAVFYFVSSVIRNRGFKNFHKSAIAYVITTVGCFLLMFVIDATGSFGAAKRVPAVSAISRAYISYNGMSVRDETNDFGSMFSYTNIDTLTCVTDREDLQVIHDLHKSVVEDIKKFNGDNEWDEYYDNSHHNRYRVLYKLKSGGWMLREYLITDQQYNMLSQLDGSECMKKKRVNSARSTVKKAYEYIENRRKWDNSSKVFPVTLSTLLHDTSFDDQYDQMIPFGASIVEFSALPSDFEDEFIKHFENDIMSMPSEQYLRSMAEVYELSFGDSDTKITVRDDFTETIAYLKSCGFGIPTDGGKTLDVFMSGGNVSIASIEMTARVSGEEPMLGNMSGPDSYKVKDENGIEINCLASVQDSGYIRDLVGHTANEYCGEPLKDGICFALVANGRTYFIRPEYTDKARKAFIEMFFSDSLRRLSLYEDGTNNDANVDKQLAHFLNMYGEEIRKEYGDDSYDQIVEWAYAGS